MTKSAGNYGFGHSYWKKILNGKLHFLCSVGLTHLWIILFNGTFISFIVEKFLYSLKLFGTAVLFFFNYQFPFFHFSFSSFSLFFMFTFLLFQNEPSNVPYFIICDERKQFPADLVTFTEEILNGKLHFVCNVRLRNLDVKQNLKDMETRL